MGASFKLLVKPKRAHFMSLGASKSRRNDGGGALRPLEIPILAFLVASTLSPSSTLS